MTWFYYLLNIFMVSGLGYILWRQQSGYILKKYFWPALLIKLICGVLLTLYYDTYFGGGDARLYQSQADLVTEYARISPISYLRLLLTRQYESETLRTSMVYFWYSNSYFMVMVLSSLNFLTGGQHYLNTLYFSLFSFWGLWQLSTTLVIINSRFKFPVLLSFLFFPSVMFWSAGVGKEAIYLGSLAWLVAAVLRVVYAIKGPVWYNLLEIVVAGYVLWKIKFYFAALAYALLFGFATVELLSRKYTFLSGPRARWLFICFVVLVGGFLVFREKDVINIENFYFQLMRSYDTLTERSVGKPALNFPGLEPTITSILRYSPSAIVQTILRPFFWEWYNVFYLIAGLENLFVLGILSMTLIKIPQRIPFSVPLWAWAMLAYILIISALIGLFTPNIGSLSRYKTAFMPFLIFLLLIINAGNGDLVKKKTNQIET